MSWLFTPRPKLLIASLSLNLFLAGSIGAWVLVENFTRTPIPPPIYRMMKSADDNSRTVIQAAYAKRELELHAVRKIYRSANQAFVQALEADPFKPSEFKAANEARNQARIEINRITQDLALEVLPKLDLETRKKLARKRQSRGKHVQN
jgi:uncharacterized membrane protein